MTSPIAFLSITDVAKQLRQGILTSVAITELMLERIETHNATLNAFITVTPARAMADAQRADKELSQGKDRGPLHGIPIAIKDLIATQGILTTGGSSQFANWIPDADATVVTKLKEAGTVLLGKTGLHELAYGTTSQNAFFGDVCNPWNTDYISGGSSGGSAAAVAAGLAYAAVGTDTGCSIRQPAHCCGIVGHKPSFGLVSKTGVMPLVWSMDHIGPMTRSVSDAILMLRHMAGFDATDAYSAKHIQFQNSDQEISHIKGLKLGVVRRFFFEGRADAISVVDSALQKLAARGAEIIELDIPEIEHASNAGRTLFAEALAIHAKTLDSDPSSFGEEVRGKLEALKKITAIDYARAKNHQRDFRRYMDQLLTQCDVLCSPTSTISAVPRAALPDDYARNAWKNTCVFDFTGQPSVSIPCGFTPGTLPIGLMLTGRYGEDAKLLDHANSIEVALDSARIPPNYR